jgi:hypothetical protein
MSLGVLPASAVSPWLADADMQTRIYMKPFFRHTPAVLAAVLLSACATLSLPDYAPGHPAHPDATPAPVAASSSALDSYRPAAAGR